MIRIAIVDDNKQMQKIINGYIENIVSNRDDIEIKLFSDAEAFLNSARKQGYDILFSDIQMNKMSGLELGKEIRKIQPEMYIVFITAYTEYAAESYTIEAYQYILESDLEYRLPRVVSQLINKIERKNKQYRMVGTGSNKEKLYYKDILFIYKIKASKYVAYVTVDGEVRERITLEQLCSELQSKEFVMAERGFIVNLDHVCKISGNVIYLDGNNQIKISRTKMTDVKRAMNQYWREQ